MDDTKNYRTSVGKPYGNIRYYEKKIPDYGTTNNYNSNNSDSEYGLENFSLYNFSFDFKNFELNSFSNLYEYFK